MQDNDIDLSDIPEVTEDQIAQVTKRAIRYINEMQTRRVSPSPEDILNLKRLDAPLQDQPIDPATVLAELQVKPESFPIIVCHNPSS